MKILFDTNIILDVLLQREPFVDQATQLLLTVESGKIEGLIAATTLTTIFYLCAKIIGKKAANDALQKLLSLFDVAAINRSVLTNALTHNFNDYEDAVILEAAAHSGADCIVTRNIKDFKKSHLPIYTPTELLVIIKNL